MKIKDIRIESFREEHSFRILLILDDDSQNSIWLKVGMSVPKLIRSLLQIVASLTYTFNDSES